MTSHRLAYRNAMMTSMASFDCVLNDVTPTGAESVGARSGAGGDLVEHRRGECLGDGVAEQVREWVGGVAGQGPVQGDVGQGAVAGAVGGHGQDGADGRGV